ncbi:sensor histidine kinase [Pacificibacter maritimus]|nr:HAMP domain-containing sensor histidine kinase [Pacificibacter maritimus]
MSHSQFESHFIHDVRACLRAADTLPEWIVEDLASISEQIPADVFRFLSEVKVNAKRADNLILSVREFCRLEGEAEPCERLDLQTVVSSVVAAFSPPEGFSITTELQPQVCNVPAGALQHVIVALIDNACRHNTNKTGSVHLTNIQTDGALFICDDGEGIPEAYCESVFAPFTTLKPRDVVEGSGFGLTIARRRVENWGGSLCIIPNAAYRGATLSVTF